MNLGIKYKLFFILLSASLIIISFMFVFTRMSFERGLIQYMDKVQENNMAMMSQELSEIYSQHGSWESFTENPDLWDTMQRYALRKWRHDMGRGRLHHNPSHRMNLEKKADVKPLQPEYPRKNRPFFYLLDQNKQPIYPVENESIPERLYPVVAAGKIVGFLGIAHPQNVIQAEELRFFKKQTRVFLMIAFTMMLISVIVAVWTAVYLERPIRMLAQGTRALSSGNYKTRIPVKTGDEIGRLSDDFNALAKTLEDNEKDRKKWVEDIAHELRTPLTLLSGELEAVEDGVRELTSETISRLRGDIQHLICLVNDLNELSRTDKGALSYKMEDVDLSQILEEILERYEKPLNDHDLKVNYINDHSRPLTLFADYERLKQLFVNIFENNLHYSVKGGDVTVCVECTDTRVQVVIEDSGPGVPLESLPRLFDRLYRVEGSRNRSFGGSGLGLAICKNIVKAHHGNISAFSSALGGLGIRIEFPLNVPHDTIGGSDE